MITLLPIELSLLRLDSPPPFASKLVHQACNAEAVEALRSPFARSLLKFKQDLSTRKVIFGIDLSQAVSTLKTAEFEYELLALGVAALHAFVQLNWTGPHLDIKVEDLFEDPGGHYEEALLNDAALDYLAYGGEPVYHLANQPFLLALALQILGLLPSPFSNDRKQAQSTSQRSPGRHGHAWSLESVKIWRLRAGNIWLNCLDEPVPLSSFIVYEATVLRKNLPIDAQERVALSLSLSHFATLLHRSSSHSTNRKEVSALALAAAQEQGLEWALTGRMGRRTKWQTDSKAQLVVLARDRSSCPAESISSMEVTRDPTLGLPTALPLNDDTLLEATEFNQSNGSDLARSDITDMDADEQPPITPLSQAILLTLALATLPAPTSLVHLAADVLSTSQVSAFVSRVLSHPQNWSVHSMALLLRCRAEAGRSRTVERGVLQMQALVDQLRDGSPTEVSAISSAVRASDVATPRERLTLFHTLSLPPRWEMERELATRYGTLGVTKSALDIFTRLEMWEEVARCWTSLERPDRGIAIIRELLEGEKTETDLVMEQRRADETSNRSVRGGIRREAKLWCTLGDLEKRPEYYEKAWIVSNRSSSLAQRSLGATYWSRNEWARARDALRLALAINPLFPRSWFVLGCTEMRLENWAGAQEAFGRCVALEDEDAESWSNLASCHLRRGETEGDMESPDGQERDLDNGPTAADLSELIEDLNPHGDLDHNATATLPFSRKRAAFHCLRQAVKYSYDSWRMYYNYMVVAIDVGELSEACRALGRMIEMRIIKEGDAAIDLEVLEKLVNAVVRTGEEDQGSLSKEFSGKDHGRGLCTQVERLIDVSILPHCSTSARIFRARAQLYLWKQDYRAALDAHVKAYRAGVGTDDAVGHDHARFVEATRSVEEVVGVLENLGPKTDAEGNVAAKDWKFQARTLVKTFLGRVRDAFEGTSEYETVRQLLNNLK